MMNKQNPNPWARWKALLFIPLAALLTFTCARPETKRESEQTSIILPIIFEPNLDGEPSDMIPERSDRNNLFFPHGFKNPRKYHFAVNTRSGQKIFETIDPNRGWNGYFESSLCDEGEYFYNIEGVFENGQSFSKKGSVKLLRTTPITKEDIREKMIEENEKIWSRQINFNGKTIQLKEIDSGLLPEQYKEMKIMGTATQNVRFGIVDKDTYNVRWRLSNFILNEQWVTEADVDLRKIVSINTYSADEAVKRYGDNAKDGVIAINTQ